MTADLFWRSMNLGTATPMLPHLPTSPYPPCSISAWCAYQWAIDVARTYGELIEASFDLYRHLLYQDSNAADG
jgi:hypothetical protein